MLQTKKYGIPSTTTLTKVSLTHFINSFWSDVYNVIENRDDVHLLVLVKVMFNNGDFRTLADMRALNFIDKDLFIQFLVARLGILADNYKDTPFSEISFIYLVKEGVASDERALLYEQEYQISTHSFNNMKLPLTMKPAEYGEIFLSNIQENKGSYAIMNGSQAISIEQEGNVNTVHYKAPVDLKWTDTKINETTFKREIMKDTMYIKDGVKLEVKEKQLNAKPFSQGKKEAKISELNSFMTIDIETVLVDNKQTPYLICGYSDGIYIESRAVILQDLAIEAMFKEFIGKIIELKHVKYVYAHNFSGFDGILLLKHLLNYGNDTNVEPLVFNNKLMSVNLIQKINKPNVENDDAKKKKPETRTIVFKDSYLLLPMALRKLCDAFKVKTMKTNFPFNLTDINYNGEFPVLNYWTGISAEKHLILRLQHGNKPWNFMEESSKYCKIDCKALFEILVEFNKLVFNEFSLNVHGVLTLPALAMKIYKTHFMPKDTLYQMLGPVEKDIRESYTGGAVDVYITNNTFDGNILNPKAKAEKLYYYDVNSLYPTVMATMEMPVGKPILFQGDIRSVDPQAFGFFYCKITSPEYLEHPILQRRIKTKDGTRTIAGLGSWEGWIFSGEMDNAMKYGYTFEILQGYKFGKANIFKEYVERLYKLRLEYESGTPINLIAKLLMNSLYGKFGMKTEKTQVACLRKDESNNNEGLQTYIDRNKESIQDILEVGDFTIIVQNGVSMANFSQDTYHGLDVNIAVASAVTSGARVIMSKVKNNPDYVLYYTDTDSAVLNRPLPAEMVGSALGQFKLEHVIKDAVFLAPKVYAFVATDGTVVKKVKGVAKEHVESLNITDFKKLLTLASSKVFEQNKWYKNLFKGDISVAEVAYELKATSNKRQACYHLNTLPNGYQFEIFTHTIPINYDSIDNQPIVYNELDELLANKPHRTIS